MVRLALAGGRPPEAPSEGFPCLLAVEGPEQDRRWAVEKDVMTIGRGHACDVQVFGPTLLARCAVLERVDDGWCLSIEPNADVRVVGARSGVVPLYGSEEIVFGQTVLSLLVHELDEVADRVLWKKNHCPDQSTTRQSVLHCRLWVRGLHAASGRTAGSRGVVGR